MEGLYISNTHALRKTEISLVEALELAIFKGFRTLSYK